eukprot:3556099-Rhodomonas_salina.1
MAVARKKRMVSEWYVSRSSKGSSTLASDLDILRPSLSLTNPCPYTVAGCGISAREPGAWRYAIACHQTHTRIHPNKPTARCLIHALPCTLDPKRSDENEGGTKGKDERSCWIAQAKASTCSSA